MNSLIENGYIRELECGANFSYVLEDGSTFLSTEYKVLQSQTDSCFVKCMKMLYNGKIQLYYLTKGLKSFASMLSSLDPESLMIIVSNLFSDIIDVKNNGFLSCQNIDIAFERIYVDPSTYKVFLVYLPLSRHIYDEYSSFENEIRTGLVKLISGIAALSSPKPYSSLPICQTEPTVLRIYALILKGKPFLAADRLTRIGKLCRPAFCVLLQ